MKNHFNERYLSHFFYITLLFLICLFSTLINLLPHGYIIAHGDHAFLVNVRENYSRLWYLWGHIVNGRGAPVGGDPATILHYGFFYILDILGLSDTQKQNVKYFLFLFLSGVSFYISVGVIFKKIPNLYRFIGSIFYTFNNLTIIYVSYIGAYLAFHELHIFLPLIWSLFLNGLIEKKRKLLVLSIIFMFFSIGGYQNVAFLFLFLLFLIFSVIYCWKVLKIIKIKEVIVSLFIIFLYLTVISFYSFHIMNYIFNPPYYLKISDKETILALKQWIKANARPVIDCFRLVFYSLDNYPDYFPYNLPKQIFVFLSFYPAIILGLSFMFAREREYKGWLLFFHLIYLIVLLAMAKHLILKDMAFFIFTLPILCGLRSWDKFIVFLPLIYAMSFVSFLITVDAWRRKKWGGSIFIFLVVIILVYPLPFFIGKFHQSFTRSHLWGERYNTMVKMPNYYKEIVNFVNKDKSYYKIVTMPYGGQIGEGWILYPSWKYLGVDFTTLFYHNPVLSPVPNIFQFEYAKYLFQNPNQHKNFLKNLLRINGIKYIVINKDTEDRYLFSFKKLYKNSVSNFIKIDDFGNLSLYKINSGSQLSFIYTTQETTLINKTKNYILQMGKTEYMERKPLIIPIQKDTISLFKKAKTIVLKDREDIKDIFLDIGEIIKIPSLINIDKDDIYEIYFVGDKFERKLKVTMNKKSFILNDFERKNYLKIGEIRLKKGRFRVEGTSGAKLVLISKDTHKKLNEIIEVVNFKNLCYFFEKEEGEFVIR